MIRGFKLANLFPQLGMKPGTGPSVEALSNGYIVEPGVQIIQPMQDYHQASVNAAVGHAWKQPLIIILMPASGYVGP